MSIKVLESLAYQELMKEHIYATVEYMFEKNQEFMVLCETSEVNFEPDLPEDLKEALPEITHFMLANYSFETANIDTNYLSFEAFFGKDNFGVLVYIPLLSIKQILLEEYPILINVATSTEVVKEETEEPIDSMAALLNNPENAKLLKKK